MSDDLTDDLLGPLHTAPVPPLAPGELVRARGAQRARRHRALLAGTAAAVLVAAGGTGYALTGHRSDDALRVAATPPPATSAVPTVSPSGDPTPTPTTTGSSATPTPVAPPATRPSAPATTPPSPTTTSPAPRPVAIPAEGLVTGPELGQYWVRSASSRSPVAPALDPCGTGLRGATAAVAHLSGSYEMRDASGVLPESSGFSQQVVRFPSAAAAAEAAEGYRADVQACPQVQDPGGVEALRVVAADPFLVEMTFAATGEAPNAAFLDYAGIAVAGDLVATWTYGDPHGVQLDAARAAAGDVQAALCRVSDAC